MMTCSIRRVLPALVGALLLAGCSRGDPPIPIARIPPKPGEAKHAFTQAESFADTRGGYTKPAKRPVMRPVDR
jgi:hypothetical protein